MSAGPASVAPAKPRRAPGRPRDPRKREAVVAAARSLFFARGIEGVGMEAVAAAARVSKATLYALFPDKAALFEAVARAETDRMEAELGALDGDRSGLEASLRRSGEGLLRFTSRPDIAAFDLVLGLEAGRHPELARRFFEAGPGRVRTALAALLGAAMARGDLARGDPVAAAEDLVALCQGMLPLETQLGLRGPPDEAEIAARVARAVALFLRAHAPAPGAAPGPAAGHAEPRTGRARAVRALG